MGSALWAGISGLNASSKQMDVIANNVANVNTVGYKGGKTYFSDVLSQSISGGSSGTMQVGRGVEVSAVGTMFGPGSFETTGNATDVAIDGEGFFIVNDVDGASYYTRAGAFHLDTDGYLVDTNGYKLQGYNFFGANTGTITDISLRDVQSAPEVTSTFSVGANLNADTATGDTYTTTQTVYDSLGDKHSLGVIYQNTEENGYWGIQVSLDGINATSQTYSGLKFDSDGVLDKVYTSVLGATTETLVAGTVATTTFNRPGQAYQDAGVIVLTRGATNATWVASGVGVTAAYTNLSVTGATVAGTDYVYVDLDGAGGTDITFTLGAGAWLAAETISLASIDQTEVAPADIPVTFAALSNGATIGSGNVVTWDVAGTSALTITQYASTSVIKSLSNDGYASGLLKSLSVQNDGTIGGFFTNGQTADLAQIVLADFSNPWGLNKVGSCLFGETVTSGGAIRNQPGASGMGTVASNSLEMSNTDVATEFINMITAQKAYQASARVITTQDAMMSELMNIKR